MLMHVEFIDVCKYVSSEKENKCFRDIIGRNETPYTAKLLSHKDPTSFEAFLRKEDKSSIPRNLFCSTIKTGMMLMWHGAIVD